MILIPAFLIYRIVSIRHGPDITGQTCSQCTAQHRFWCGSLERAKYCTFEILARRFYGQIIFEINLNFSVSTKMNDIEK